MDVAAGSTHREGLRVDVRAVAWWVVVGPRFPPRSSW
jgi:hypothetical protein